MDKIIEWLLDGEPWVEYRTRVDLLKQSEIESEVINSRNDMITHPKIKLLLEELKSWPGTVLSSHKSAGQHYHKLSFIADLGLKKDDQGINEIIEKVIEHKSDEGPYQLPMNIPKHFGGSGIDDRAWALCDAPITLYSLTKFGLEKDKQIQKAAKYLINLIHENGWPCVVSKELGKFRGPGRKNDPCPYATLVMMKLMSQLGDWVDSKEAHVGADCLLDLWENSREQHPYMFYMGTDFRKLKAPFIWYDILHVVDVLTQFEWLKNDDRLKDMINLINLKADNEGKFTPESEWKAWSGWEFAQKKQPSRWVTYLIYRINSRISQ